MTMQLRRSVLYMPASNRRAMEKSQSLDVDVLIFDLEDAVAASAKQSAREEIQYALKHFHYPHQEVLIRINALDSPWGEADIMSLKGLAFDGIVLPKVENSKALLENIRTINQQLERKPALWLMTETPKGVLHAPELYACHPQISAIMMGTSDLGKELRIEPSHERLGLLHCLSQCLLAARAQGLDIIDGVFTDLNDAQGLRLQCQQAKDLGFDGKSLIHPKQVQSCHQAFSANKEQLQQAYRIVKAWKEAAQESQGVCLVDGQLIENLHVESAQRLIALHVLIANRSN